MPQKREIPLGEDFIPLGQDFEPVESNPGMLASIWQGANTPLTDAPSRGARSLTALPNESQGIADSLGLGGAYGAWDKIQRGGLEAVGDIASGLTSPLNVALTASTLGTGTAARAGYGTTASGLNAITKLLSAPIAAEGAIDTLSPNSSLGERGLGLLEMAGGVAGMKSKVPKVRSQTVEEAKVVLGSKRKLKLNEDGTFTDKDTGELLDKQGKPKVDDLPLGKDFEPIKGKDVELPNLKQFEPIHSEWQKVIDQEPKIIEDMFREAKKLKIDITKFDNLDDLDNAISEASSEPKLSDFVNEAKELEKSLPLNPIESDILVKPNQGKLQAPVNVTPSFSGSKRNPSLPKTEKVPPDIMLEVQKTIPDATPDEVVKHIGYVTDKKNPSKITEAINFSRALKTSIDLSAPLRQGLPLAIRGEFYSSLWPMVKSLGSENAFRLSQDEIASRALFKPTLTGTGGKVGNSFAEDAGLFLSDLTDLSRREEAIASTWAEKIPGVRASNRAYTTFLNRLRADTFENLVKQTGTTNNIPLAKNLASFINNATGRGSLGQLESIAPVLNAALFSPRFISSRLQMFRPDKFISAPAPIKKEIMKSFIATIGSGMALGELARAGGSQVSNDPTSSDFRKIRIGDKVRIDPFAGYQQYAVATSRILEAAHKHYIEEKKLNPFEKPDAIAQRFLRSKTSPVVSSAWDTLVGTDYLGNRVTLPGELNDLFMPMFIETVIELYSEDPELLPWAVPAGLGMGVNVGGPKK